MYEHFNTREKLFRRILTYVLMVVAVIVGVTGTTAYIMGYRLDLDNNDVEQITLLQLGTYPTGASVAIDDYELNWKTPGRFDELKAGWHKVKYWREGYRDWNKTVNLKATEIRWLDYARLIPRDIKTTNVANFSGMHQAVTSPSGNYILLHENPADTTFKLIDISDPRNIKVTDLALPEGIASGETRIIEWDSNSNYLLASTGEGEILRIDRRSPADSLNLTKTFNTSIASPHFIGNNSNIIFALTGNDLRQIDINAKTTSAPVLGDIVSYELYGDGKVAFVRQDEEKQEVGVWYKDKEYIYQSYNERKPTLVDFTHYYRDDYLLVARGGVLEIVDKPFEKEHTTVSVEIGEASFLTHNGSGRLIMTGGNGHISMYDLQVEELYNYDTEGYIEKPFWLDDYHIGYCVDGVLRTREFDGMNLEELVTATNFGVYSSNNERLFTFVPVDEGVALQDSSMIVSNGNSIFPW